MDDVAAPAENEVDLMAGMGEAESPRPNGQVAAAETTSPEVKASNPPQETKVSSHQINSINMGDAKPVLVKRCKPILLLKF